MAPRWNFSAGSGLSSSGQTGESPEVGTGRSGGAEELVNSENKKKETPQHVYFLCLSVMSLILHLPVENLPRNSVANGSRHPFFRHCNSSLCYAVIKILLLNELSCKMKLIIKKPL